MPVVSTLKRQVDQPVFEWMRFAPQATSSLFALATTDDGYDRHMYAIAGLSFQRYDSWSDSWQELAPPPTIPVTAVDMKYSKFSGHRTGVLGASGTSIEIGGIGPNNFQFTGLTLRILYGQGAGQERLITGVSGATIWDNGVATTALIDRIGDSIKKWRPNQWEGYSCRLVYGAGAGQVRRILYNDRDTLYFSDPNFQAIDPFNNTGWGNVLPLTIPVTTAGAQTHFQIESTTLTVHQAWDVTPDLSSQCQILSGGLWLFTSNAAAPWHSWYFYDVLSDSWFWKTSIGGQLLAAMGTDFKIDRTGEVAGAFLGGSGGGSASAGITVTASTLQTLTVGPTFETDRWTNHQLRVVAGTGISQRRRIIGNSGGVFYVDRPWDITPDTTSRISVFGDTDKIWLVGNANSTIWTYSIERDLWSAAHIRESGIARAASVFPISGPSGLSYARPHEGFAVNGITYVAEGLLTVGIGDTGGTSYTIGDLLTLTNRGSTGQVWVTGITTGGIVTSLIIASVGTGYGGGITQSTVSGGSGGGLLVALTSGKAAHVNLMTNHDFRHGETVDIRGLATDTSFNSRFPIIGLPGLTAFCIPAASTAAANPTTATAQTTTLLVDSGASWNTNVHQGRVVILQTAGTGPTTQSSRVVSNTANSITVSPAFASAAVNGQSRYLVQEIGGYGTMFVDPATGRENGGWVSAAGTTFMRDNSKSWIPQQWQGFRVRIRAGAGEGAEVGISGNNSNTLFVSNWTSGGGPGITPDNTSKYDIMDAYGSVITAVSTTVFTGTAGWRPNILAGKRLRIVAGGGIGNEVAVSSNGITQVTVASAITGLAFGSVYQIYDAPVRGAGCSLTWLFGLSNPANAGRFLLSARGGGSNAWDVYDIPSDRWILTQPMQPLSMTLTTGSMYAYDGRDSLIVSKDTVNRLYEVNLRTGEVVPCGVTPFAQGTATLGNKMEIMTTEDGLKYLYVMRHSGQEMWRTLKFW